MKATIDPIDSLTNWDGTDHFISNLCTDTITTSPLLLLLLQARPRGMWSARTASATSGARLEAYTSEPKTNENIHYHSPACAHRLTPNQTGRRGQGPLRAPLPLLGLAPLLLGASRAKCTRTIGRAR